MPDLRSIIPYVIIAIMFVFILKMNSEKSKLKCEDAHKQAIIEVIKDDNKIKQETERKVSNLDRDGILAIGSNLGILRPDQDY